MTTNMIKPLEDYDPALIEAARKYFAQSWVFQLGAVDEKSLPDISGIEVAFAGRSNVGKSSLINALTHQNHLARTSKTPGRTREVNFFRADETFCLADMPGYGYARASKTAISSWNRLILDYLRGRSCLRRVYMLIDGRHGVKPNDIEIMDVLDVAAVSYQLVFTKRDKVKKEEFEEYVEKARLLLAKRPAAHPVFLSTSSEKGTGIPELRAEMYILAKGL
ncbi:MAG: YihA family ribosome biogenesis GTP-binding protein [Cohaesibacteraceae bacterium]|nr:YihA family ribosome biogenesis GTP-binding protein [Cohaesibacteraceae bacterium]